MAARGELVFIRNIPDRFRSSALRLFFEEAIEAKFFKCFHYRHRPENVHFGVTLGGSTPGEGKGTGKTCCCVVDVKSPQDVERFITEFNFKPWIDAEGEDEHGMVVVIQKVDRTAELDRLPELNPPAVFPKGNVGTPKAAFMQLIKDCRLPTSVIGRLGLQWKIARKRRYAQVPAPAADRRAAGHCPAVAAAAAADPKPNYSRRPCKKIRTHPLDRPPPGGGLDDDPIPERGDSDAEEWERHESLHADDDLGGQGRNKERLFEEEIEYTWEKGGSGLVFYTDATAWDRDEGGNDEKGAVENDHDLDTTGYYSSYKSDEWRDVQALQEKGALFHRGRYHDPGRPAKGGAAKAAKAAKAATKQAGKVAKCRLHAGYGSKILKAQGWEEGKPLGREGSRQSGLAEPLEADGQCDKSGIGYLGEKRPKWSGGGPS